MTDQPTVSRRGVLAGAALLSAGGTLASCREKDQPHTPALPGARLLSAALVEEDELLASYDAAVAAHPGLARLLDQLRADHAAHRAALLAAGAQPATALASASGSPSPAVPRSAPKMRRALGAAESAASRARSGACLQAPQRLAPLLGSISASEAAHAALLRHRA